ncbi:YdcF family protein [Pseudonocardia bannensis]|uniref:YdcF family protein n=1 Tax=Pseudonocardia bannensis TaxID=630973 RepID=A0A848DPB0_9PSEU|nr:YdcF family protein [Pseudonocardia bannensis]NMH94657.1 YdcF family protein [Pseudonocardia bannensis]
MAPTVPLYDRGDPTDSIDLGVPGAGGPGRPRVRWGARLLVGALLVVTLIVGGTAFRVWQTARVNGDRAVDAVLVLGAAQYDGDPSPVFAARLRHAVSLYERGLAPRIVTVGGSRAGDEYTEAEAGRRYLIERGVPSSAVVAVGEGSDTLGSMQAVAARAERDGWSTTLIVSDPWHSLRARTMAEDSGLEAWTSPTRRGPVVQTRETQARYIFRETGALLYYRLIGSSPETDTTGLG